MIIDIHNHITPKGHPFHLPVEEYLKNMDELKIDKTVILGKDYGKLGDRQNANLTDGQVAEFVSAYPDRFIGFTAVHPDREIKTNVERLERAVELGLKGIKINPHAGFYPNDSRLYPVYEKAEELQLPVMCHTGVKAPAEGTRVKYNNPVYLDDVVVDFPDLTVIISHGGYPWVEESIMVGLFAENVYVEISTLNQLEQSMGFEVVTPTLKKLTASLGAHRVLFGSDGIFNQEALINNVKNADFLSERDKGNILGETSKKIFKL